MIAASLLQRAPGLQAGFASSALAWLTVILLAAPPAAAPGGETGSDAVIADAARLVVKIYGAGGFRGLEAYQTGFLVSPEGHVMTAMSTVLDSEEIDCVLDDGRRYSATLLGIDPRRETALLDLEAEDLPAISLAEAETAEPGTRCFALSNLFGVAVGDERASVQQGVVSAVVPLEARRGPHEAVYDGDVYLLDFTVNNPGAPGGLLVDAVGRPLGMIGKELRASDSGIWLNYALPMQAVAESYADLVAGRRPTTGEIASVEPFDTGLLGFLLVPDLLERTPPFVESVEPDSAAAAAGLAADDLIVAIGTRSVTSCAAVATELGRLDARDTVRLSVIRDGRIVACQLGPRGEPEAAPPGIESETP